MQLATFRRENQRFHGCRPVDGGDRLLERPGGGRSCASCQVGLPSAPFGAVGPGSHRRDGSTCLGNGPETESQHHPGPTVEKHFDAEEQTNDPQRRCGQLAIDDDSQK